MNSTHSVNSALLDIFYHNFIIVDEKGVWLADGAGERG